MTDDETMLIGELNRGLLVRAYALLSAAAGKSIIDETTIAAIEADILDDIGTFADKLAASPAERRRMGRAAEEQLRIFFEDALRMRQQFRQPVH